MVISTTYYTRKFSISIATILIIFGILPSVVVYFDPDSLGEGVPFFVIILVSLIFIFAAFFFVYPVIVNTTKPKYPLTYDGYKKGKKAIFVNLLGAVFVATFLSVFVFAGFTAESEIAKYVILLFAVIFGFMFLVRIIKGAILMIKARRFSNSLLECDTDHTFGEVVQGVLVNRKVFRELDKLNITLRNLTEYPGFNSGHKDTSTNGFLTEQHSITIGKVENVSTERIPFEIDIPPYGKPTNYINHNPTYWELVFENKEVGYFSRFFLQVH